MKTEKLKLGQVALNERNPRTITDVKMGKLINSILVFPKVLSMRPVVVDEANTALGGNMRMKALNAIAAMTENDIAERLGTLKDFNERTGGEREQLVAYWREWLKAPSVEIVRASQLTEREKKEFVIKDNVSFGTWDWSLLDKEWDTQDLSDWGMDVWMPTPETWSGNAPSGGGSFNGGALPPELEGQDITPDELPKLQGDDEVLMGRVIIVYPKEREHEVLNLLGLEKLEKIVYNIDEL